MLSKAVSAFAGGLTTIITASGAEPTVPAASPSIVLSQPAGSTNAFTLKLDSASPGISKQETELGFSKGVTEAGLSVGVGLGSKIFGSTDTHDLVLSKLYIGRVVSDVVARDNWYRGNWELLGEIFGGGQFEPRGAYFVGLTPVLRYDFATGKQWSPFLDAGAGVTATDISVPDLNGTFQFNLQTGPGVHWLVSKNTVLTLQYRFLHFSNAGIERPNHGVNSSVIYAGIGWLF